MAKRKTTKTPKFGNLFSKAELEAFAVAERMKPSDFAEAHRFLRKEDSSMIGPFRLDNSPYTRGIMDITAKPGVNQSNVMKAAQIGVSEAARCLLVHWAAVDADPVGYVLPNKEIGQKITRTLLLPMFEMTPVLKKLLPPGKRGTLITYIHLLNGFQLFLAWSGSSTSTSSTPWRICINDEVDKMSEWAGGEPDPVGRTWKRLRSYGDKKLQLNISTPTTNTGRIAKLFEESTVKLYFYVPCPHCCEYQRLFFPNLSCPQIGSNAKGSKADRAAAVMRDETAVYVCEHCGSEIVEMEKDNMVRAGRWSTEEGYVLDANGQRFANAEDVEVWPNGTRVGFQISAMYCLWESWQEIAAEFIFAEGDLTKSFNFRTETLGEPFAYKLARATTDVFVGKCERAKLQDCVVPDWAWCLTMTVDTQKTGFYAVVRAWGGGMKSQRIWHGKPMTFDELDELIFRTDWHVDGGRFPAMKIRECWIDSGGTATEDPDMTRTMQVYMWALRRQPVCRAIKGSPKPMTVLYSQMKDPVGKSGKEIGRKAPQGLEALWVDTHACNDLLAEMIQRGTVRDDQTDPRTGETEDSPMEEIWLLNKLNDGEYNRHMAAVHKTAVRRGTEIVKRWEAVHSGGRHDYRDCEAYQIALSYKLRIPALPSEEEIMQQKINALAEVRQAEQDRNLRNQKRSNLWKPTKL